MIKRYPHAVEAHIRKTNKRGYKAAIEANADDGARKRVRFAWQLTLLNDSVCCLLESTSIVR